MLDIFDSIDVVEHSFLITKKGSEILDLSGVYSESVAVALKTIQQYGDTVLCWFAARDLPISHMRTFARYIREGAPVALLGRLFCDIINSTKGFVDWVKRMGLCDIANLSSITGTFSVYVKQVGGVLLMVLNKSVQDVCSVVSIAFDLVYQGQEIYRHGVCRQAVMKMGQDVLKIAIKSMSFMPHIRMWKVAMNSCAIINSAASIYLIFYGSDGGGAAAAVAV